MQNWYDRNVSLVDSIIRYVFGSAIILGVLTLTLEVWVSLASVYLIGTALITWDPIYFVSRKLRQAVAAKIGLPDMAGSKPIIH